MLSEGQTNGMELSLEGNRCSQKGNKRHGIKFGGESVQSEGGSGIMELGVERNRCSQKSKQTAWNCVKRGIGAVRRTNKRQGFVLRGESV